MSSKSGGKFAEKSQWKKEDAFSFLQSYLNRYEFFFNYTWGEALAGCLKLTAWKRKCSFILTHERWLDNNTIENFLAKSSIYLLSPA